MEEEDAQRTGTQTNKTGTTRLGRQEPPLPTYASASKGALFRTDRPKTKSSAPKPKRLSHDEKTIIVQLKERILAKDSLRTAERALYQYMQTWNKALVNSRFPSIQICEFGITVSGNVSITALGNEVTSDKL